MQLMSLNVLFCQITRVFCDFNFNQELLNQDFSIVKVLE